MEKYLEYQSKIDALRREGLGILDQVESEERDTTEDEDKKLDQLRQEKTKLERARDRHVEFHGLQSEIESFGREPHKPEPEQSPEQGFRSFGEQLMAVVQAARGNMDPRLNRAATGLNEGTPAEGGFLVQQDYADTLLKRVYETGVVAQRCRKLPISGNANGLKIPAINETSRADGSRWGGIRAYWKDEAAQKTASKPAFREMELSLNKLIGLCYATDELLQDAAALEMVVMQGFEEEFGFKLDDAVINGTGAGQPLGVLNSGAVVQVTKETGQPADTILAENIVKMWSRMYAKSRGKAVWFVNQDVEPQLYTMSLSVGTGGIPVYMPANGLAGSPYATLMGRPVVPIEQCPTLGDAGDILLADMSQYVLADKGGMQNARSIHLKFDYDETVFRFVYRVDGQPIWNSALTPYKGSSNTVSPFVRLQARS